MKIIILALALMLSHNVHADPTVRHFLDNKKSAIVEAYITGAGQGMVTSTTMLKFKKLPQLFCPPSSLSLNYSNYVDIIDAEVKKQGINEIGNEPVSPHLLMGLISTFPCKK